jgi:hypothetical protein
MSLRRDTLADQQTVEMVFEDQPTRSYSAIDSLLTCRHISVCRHIKNESTNPLKLYDPASKERVGLNLRTSQSASKRTKTESMFVSY